MDVSCLKAESPAMYAEAIKPKLLYRGKSFEERIKGELEQLGLPVLYQRQKKAGSQAIPDLIPRGRTFRRIYSCLKQTGLDGLFFVPAICPYLHLIWGNALLWKQEINGML